MLLDLYSNLNFWDKLFIKLKINNFAFEEIEKFVPKKGTIIDLGCGYGLFANYLSLIASEREILGLDLDERRIATARQTEQFQKKVKFQVKDICNFTIPSIDAITLIGVLYLIPYNEQEIILRECFNKLKKGGKLIIHEVDTKPCWKFFIAFIKEILMSVTKITLSSSSGIGKFYFRGCEDYIRLLSGIGFKVSTRLLNTYRYQSVIYVCEK